MKPRQFNNGQPFVYCPDSPRARKGSRLRGFVLEALKVYFDATGEWHTGRFIYVDGDKANVSINNLIPEVPNVTVCHDERCRRAFTGAPSQRYARCPVCRKHGNAPQPSRRRFSPRQVRAIRRSRLSAVREADKRKCGASVIRRIRTRQTYQEIL